MTKTLFPKLFALSLFAMLIIPSFAFAQTQVSTEQRNVLLGVVDDVEEAVLSEDATGLLNLMTSDLASEIGPAIKGALASPNDVLEFNIYAVQFSRIDAEHTRMDAQYSIESRGSNGKWSVKGLSTYFVLEEAQGSFLISDTNLNKVITPFDFMGLIGDNIKYILWFAMIGFVLSAFWIWMLVDVLMRDIPNETTWVLVIIFAGWIGAAIYFFTGRRKFKMKK